MTPPQYHDITWQEYEEFDGKLQEQERQILAEFSTEPFDYEENARILAMIDADERRQAANNDTATFSAKVLPETKSECFERIKEHNKEKVRKRAFKEARKNVKEKTVKRITKYFKKQK